MQHASALLRTKQACDIIMIHDVIMKGIWHQLQLQEVDTLLVASRPP